ncbi:MAG: hypothetical protein JSS61_03870 [Verrucomicrobia bacterium]|nr:hypothetical protein [Verrucomicrobiota bacterium]
MGKPHTIFLFGEAEKGDFCTPMICRSLPQLADHFGNPPEESLGISYAVQALLFNRELIFFRVKEEGYSIGDYMRGIQILESREGIRELAAICMPGVGDAGLIDAMTAICGLYRSLLITSDKDLYDFLTHKP